MGLRFDEWFLIGSVETLESFAAPAVKGMGYSIQDPSTFDVPFDHFPSPRFPSQKNWRAPFSVFPVEERPLIQNPTTRVDRWHPRLFAFEQLCGEERRIRWQIQSQED